ncbi:MAG: hypothetical protein ABL997_07050, partial [Planctomycetota bacterium]
MPRHLRLVLLAFAIALTALVLLEPEATDPATNDAPHATTPTDRDQVAAVADAPQEPEAGPAGPPLPGERTTWVEPEVIGVDFRLKGRVEVAAARRTKIQVWLIEFGEDP